MVSMREKIELSIEGSRNVSELASVIHSRSINIPVKHITVRKNFDAQHWDVSTLDPSVIKLVGSRTWLSVFGLKVQHLKRSEVLKDIGFIVKEAFVPILGKYVKSSYSDGVFHKADGSRPSRTYNIIANEGYLKQIENRLSSAVDLYRSRLEWLNTGSRNIFGVLQEHAVTILIDIKNLSPQTFENFIKVVKCFVVDQVRQISQFNLIRCAEMPEWFSPVLVEVTDENIGKVCNWLDHLDLLTNLTSYCTSECLSKVNSANQNHEAVYLIAEGDSCTCTPELLREQVFNMRHPLHIVSYECNDVPSLNYMASLCRHTGGRFHAYQNFVRLPEYSATHWDPEQNQAGITICELEYGGWPTSLTQREDCVLIFEELEEARTTLEQIRQILKDVENIPRQCATVLGQQGAGGKTVCPPTSLRNTCGRREEHMSSKEWLERHSLKSQQLGLYETLANVSFKHCDGVVDLLKPPTSDVSLNEDEPLPTDGRDSQYFNIEGKHREKNYSSESSQPAAIVHPKLINARYCDEFVHVLWKDASLVHVQVTPQLYQLYSRRVKATLTAIQRRIDWLCEGSRELFGTITEDEVCVLIDTSTSMLSCIEFVKHKLLTLVQEQLKQKSRVNFVAFGSTVKPWSDSLRTTTESNLNSAADWIKNLSCSGTTNTLAALQFALACKRTQGLYLLSDGRPDQDPKTVLLKMHLINRIPIHTVSFNCADKKANQFLFDLAKESCGRFHYFSDTSKHPASADQWESEDLRLLREEYRRGLDCLEKMAQLRDECQRLAWKSIKPLTVELDNKIDKRKARRPARSRSMYTNGRQGSNDTSLDSDQTLVNNNQTDSLRRSTQSLKQKPNTAAFVKYPEIIESKPKKPTGSKSPFSCRSKRENDYDPYYAFVKSLHQDHAQNEDFILFETKEVLDRQAKRYHEQIKAHLTTKLAARDSKLKAERNNAEPITIPNWIARYGLRAQELRLLDLLAPIAVRLRPSYVPALKKHVYSEVLRKSLPLAFVSPTKPTRKPIIRLINPLAIDYVSYEKSLTAALGKIEKKLVEIIVRYLEEDAIKNLRRTLHLEKYPKWWNHVCWYQHRKEILRTFESANWPFPKEDFICLTRELDEGANHLSLALKIREYPNPTRRRSMRSACGHMIQNCVPK